MSNLQPPLNFAEFGAPGGALLQFLFYLFLVRSGGLQLLTKLNKQTAEQPARLRKSSILLISCRNWHLTLNMTALFKCVVLSIDLTMVRNYTGVLYQIKSLNKIERMQRSFTSKFITGMRTLSYEDRLKSLNLYSVQRRFERYTIIYSWKILEFRTYNSQLHIIFLIEEAV